MRSLRRVTSCGVLLHRRTTPREYLFLRVYHAWDLPKGRLEAGEDERAGALRELAEETGITADAIALDPEFRFETSYLTSDHGRRVEKTLIVFLAQLLRETPIRLTEHHGHAWVRWPTTEITLVKRWQDLLTQAELHIGRG
ncbi:MAG TPA: NUDIX domain-containing protein [Planctomycetota bacterium]|nr:NUDIX domain-containing protein [Planctomycetota bacterium]